MPVGPRRRRSTQRTVTSSRTSPVTQPRTSGVRGPSAPPSRPVDQAGDPVAGDVADEHHRQQRDQRGEEHPPSFRPSRGPQPARDPGGGRVSAPTDDLSAAAAEIATARKDMLRIATAGSVDDGKSTLIGRLLYDSKAVLEDQYEAISRASRGDHVDLSLLTDGLRAEREQGITSTSPTVLHHPAAHLRPGRHPRARAVHPQHGHRASTADLAIVLVDARKGMLEQSPPARLPRRAAAGAARGGRGEQDGPRRLVRGRVHRDPRRVHRLRRAADVPDVTVVPISALAGDNVVTPSRTCPGTTARRCCTT